jgi:hypothetical protein
MQTQLMQCERRLIVHISVGRPAKLAVYYKMSKWQLNRLMES